MFKRGEVYYVNFGGYGRGSEQGGIRPAVIVSNNIGNKNSSILIVAPITKQIKNNIPTHVLLDKYPFLADNSTVLMEQIITKDKKFIGERIGKLSDIDMLKIDHSARISLQLYNMNSYCKEDSIENKIRELKELKGYINRHVLKYNETNSITNDIEEYNCLYQEFKDFCKNNNLHHKFLYNEYINI